MTKEQADKVIEVNKIALEKYKSVVVTSDSAIYLDSELEPIAAHCKDLGKTYFVVKSVEATESIEVEVVKEKKKK